MKKKKQIQNQIDVPNLLNTDPTVKNFIIICQGHDGHTRTSLKFNGINLEAFILAGQLDSIKLDLLKGAKDAVASEKV